METVKSKKTGVFKIVPTGGGLASASEFSVEYIAGMAANVQFRPKVCDCTVLFVCSVLIGKIIFTETECITVVTGIL